MRQPQTHIIGQLTLDLALGKSDRAYAQMEDWKAILQQSSFLERLNGLLDQYAPKDHYVSLDVLEIKVEEPITPTELEDQLILALHKQLERLTNTDAISKAQGLPSHAPGNRTAFRQQDQHIPFAPKSDDQELDALAKNDLPGYSNQQLQQLNAAERNQITSNRQQDRYTPVTQRIEELVFYFLDQGQLPWYASQEMRHLIASEWDQILLNLPQNTTNSLIDFFRKNPNALLRFIGHTTTDTLSQLLSHWFAIELPQRNMLQALCNYSEHFTNNAYVSKKIPWSALFQILLRNQPLPLWMVRQHEIQELIQFLASDHIKACLSQKDIWESIFTLTDKNDMTASEVIEFINKRCQNQAYSPENEQAYRKEKTGNRAPAGYKTEVLYVENAGIVLLNPFLPYLFQNLELTDGKTFLNEQAQEKAVHILQFIATGQEECMEYAMPLNKLLCGLPLDHPLERFVKPSEEDKQSCEVLIRAAIKQWTVLKNTSSVELQHSFLQREGKLAIRPDEQWGLQVERKSIDILLDKLPYGWGYSVIQLPWMNNMLFVEW